MVVFTYAFVHVPCFSSQHHRGKKFITELASAKNMGTVICRFYDILMETLKKVSKAIS